MQSGSMAFIRCQVLASCVVLAATLSVKEEPPPGPPLIPPSGGVFCRGSACRYKNAAMGVAGAAAHEAVTGGGGSSGGDRAFGVAGAKVAAETALAIGQDALLSQKEFCRGLTCVDGMGHPLDRSQETFVAQCAYLFKNGGIAGSDAYRTVQHVYDSFGKICMPRVGAPEMPLCRAYADVVAAALAPELEENTVGSVEAICKQFHEFFIEVKQAQIDLMLFQGSVKPDEKVDSSEVGPTSDRGIRWANHLRINGAVPLPGQDDESEDATLPRESSPEKYKITMPSWDNALHAVIVPRPLFDHCEALMTEIMVSKTQPANRAAQLTVDWCGFQSMAGNRPDWTERTCKGFGVLMGLALRNIPDVPPMDKPPKLKDGELPEPFFGQVSMTLPPTFTMMPTIPDPPKPGAAPKSGPVPARMGENQMRRMMHPVKRFLMRPDQVCQQMFVAAGAAYRAETLMRESYRTSFRLPSQGLSLPPLTDPFLMALQQAADFRKSAAAKKVKEDEKVKDAFAESKEELANFDQTPGAGPAPAGSAPASALPDSDSFDPEVTTLARGFSSLRQRVVHRVDLA